eukprot:15484720-Alexandrium_andersonii.AAC.1
MGESESPLLRTTHLPPIGPFPALPCPGFALRHGSRVPQVPRLHELDFLGTSCRRKLRRQSCA